MTSWLRRSSTAYSEGFLIALYCLLLHRPTHPHSQCPTSYTHIQYGLSATALCSPAPVRSAPFPFRFTTQKLTFEGYVLLQTVLFRGTPQIIYRLGFTGALLSYCIVVFKSLGRPQPNAAWVRRAFVDENVQYAVLALYWWISKPINCASSSLLFNLRSWPGS